MFYRELKPSPALRARGLGVDCIWILDHPADLASDPIAPEKILPDGRVELIFNIGKPYRQVGTGETGVQPNSFVVGQLERYLEVIPTGHVSIIGMRFLPTGLHRLLGIPLGELTGRSIGLEDLGPTHAAGLLELEERLLAARTWFARVRLIEEHLQDTSLHAPPRARPGRMETAVDLIRRSHGRLDLGRVIRAVNVSARTLDRRFRIEVGLSPKLFSRQIRFQRVFELLSRTPRGSWTEIALASGCFDQAHLNREFRSFAGEPPAAFLRSSHELSDHLTGLV